MATADIFSWLFNFLGEVVRRTISISFWVVRHLFWLSRTNGLRLFRTLLTVKNKQETCLLSHTFLFFKTSDSQNVKSGKEKNTGTEPIFADVNLPEGWTKMYRSWPTRLLFSLGSFRKCSVHLY